MSDANRFIMKISKTEIEKICKSIVQSTINSVLKSSPFDNLPKERYDDWKEISLLFDSRVY